MNKIPRLFLAAASSAVAGLAACIVPPSMFERPSWGPPPDYWQEQGRYRQAPEENQAPEAQAQLDPEARGQGAAPHGELAKGGTPPETPLYSWDGGIVDGAPQGRVTTQAETPRGLETPPAGRTHIIELYQQVLDERDALADEVEYLRKSLEQTVTALQEKNRESNELVARVTATEAAHQELMRDNQEIAGRLVQAQIRRLEAEKLLLETRIEQERSRVEGNARTGATPSRSSFTRPASSEKGEE